MCIIPFIQIISFLLSLCCCRCCCCRRFSDSVPISAVILWDLKQQRINELLPFDKPIISLKQWFIGHFVGNFSLISCQLNTNTQRTAYKSENGLKSFSVLWCMCVRLSKQTSDSYPDVSYLKQYFSTSYFCCLYNLLSWPWFHRITSSPLLNFSYEKSISFPAVHWNVVHLTDIELNWTYVGLIGACECVRCVRVKQW